MFLASNGRLIRRVRVLLDRVAQRVTLPADRLSFVEPSISSWSSARQIRHILLATELNLRAIDKLIAGEGARRPRPRSFAGGWILWRGRIPRGRAKSPTVVEPEESIDVRGLEAEVASLRERMEGLQPSAIDRAKGRIDHPLLGGFSARDWLRFIAIHGEHHLAIVDEIQERWRGR